MLKTGTFLLLFGLVALPAAAQIKATSPGAGNAAAPSHATPLSGQPGTPGAAAPSSSATASVAAGSASNQFSTEQAAKAHCPGDAIVWANLSGSKAYHTSADRYYGKTRHGTYMCQKEAEQAGFHAPGQRPSKAVAKGTGAKPQ